MAAEVFPAEGKSITAIANPISVIIILFTVIILGTVPFKSTGSAIGIGIWIDLENRTLSIPMPIPAPTPNGINSAFH